MTITPEIQAMINAAVAAALAQNNKAKATTNAVAPMPTGKITAQRVQYTKFIPVPKKDANGNIILRTSGKFAGKPMTAGFRKQNRKAIILRWANGVRVVFFKTQDVDPTKLNCIHDSRTPTVLRTLDEVKAELKRWASDEAKAIQAADWLNDVTPFNREDAATQYGKADDALKQLMRESFPYTPKTPRATKTTVAPSVPLATAAAGDIPF